MGQNASRQQLHDYCIAKRPSVRVTIGGGKREAAETLVKRGAVLGVRLRFHVSDCGVSPAVRARLHKAMRSAEQLKHLDRVVFSNGHVAGTAGEYELPIPKQAQKEGALRWAVVAGTPACLVSASGRVLDVSVDVRLLNADPFPTGVICAAIAGSVHWRCVKGSVLADDAFLGPSCSLSLRSIAFEHKR